MDHLTFDTHQDIARWRGSFNWMHRPDRVNIGTDLRRDIGPLRAMALTGLVPICGCIPSTIASLMTLGGVLAHAGIGWPDSIWGPLTGLITVALVGLATKLTALLVSYAVLQKLFPARTSRQGATA